MEICENVEIVIAGDPEQSYTCITSETRPFQWHSWLRAEYHIHRMQDVNFFLRGEAAGVCHAVVQACEATMKPPKRVVPAFGWGKLIHPADKPCRIKGLE